MSDNNSLTLWLIVLVVLLVVFIAAGIIVARRKKDSSNTPDSHNLHREPHPRETTTPVPQPEAFDAATKTSARDEAPVHAREAHSAGEVEAAASSPQDVADPGHTGDHQPSVGAPQRLETSDAHSGSPDLETSDPDPAQLDKEQPTASHAELTDTPRAQDVSEAAVAEPSDAPETAETASSNSDPAPVPNSDPAPATEHFARNTANAEALDIGTPITEDTDELREAELRAQREDVTQPEPNPAADENRTERALTSNPQRTESDTGVPIASAEEQLKTAHEREDVKLHGYSGLMDADGSSKDTQAADTSNPDHSTPRAKELAGSDGFHDLEIDDDEFEIPRDEQGRRLDPYGNPVEE